MSYDESGRCVLLTQDGLDWATSLHTATLVRFTHSRNGRVE